MYIGSTWSRLGCALGLSLAMACSDGKEPPEDTDPGVDPEEVLLSVPAESQWTLPGLEGRAHVLVTEMGVPYIYAENRSDLGQVVGFVLARDRFFYMDLARRLSKGEAAQLLGADALEMDIESRMTGMTFIAERLLEMTSLDPEMAAYFDGVAEGVNAYIAAVEAGELDAPTEYDIAYGVLGFGSAAELMEPFDRSDVAAGMATILYESGFETKDVGRTADEGRLVDRYVGDAEASYRQAGLEQDHWARVEPPKRVAQAPDWQSATAAPVAKRSPKGKPARVPTEVISRLAEHTEAIERRLGHEWVSGFGSNAWAVSGEASADGRAMVATDGHLELSVPPLFYQIGINTALLGDGEVDQVGLMTPAMPLISTGTNGKIAFGQTQLFGDITDWYAERLTLDATGRPASSLFQGSQKALQSVSESIEVADIPVLGSEGRTVSFERFLTFDGRWITSIEGQEVSGPEEAPEGKVAVMMMGDWIVPEDLNDDGYVSAVSFDYTGFDVSAMAQVISEYSEAQTLDSFISATENLVAYSLNLVAGDDKGEIYYTGFQAVPCRSYLARDGQGEFAEGADPNLILDGTQYPGFTIPISEGRIDFSDRDEPTRCVVPYEEYPHSRNPAQGYLVSANQDPGGLSFDGSLANDPWYIGGPWMEGYRADEIAQVLEAGKAEGLTMEDMKTLQANHTSVLARDLVPVLREAIEELSGLEEAPTNLSLARAKTLYEDNEEAITQVMNRFEVWETRGWQAESGVETFYESPTADERQDAIATMIYNVWMGRFVSYTINDESIPGLGFPTSDTGRFRLLSKIIEGRGAGNPEALASWHPELQASIFFDIRSTDELEGWQEVAILSMVEALEWLESAPTGPGEGGFGTADQEEWLWGLRHWVRFNSLLGGFLGGDNPLFASLIAPLNITPETLPLAEDMEPGDPRADLPGFPRHSDHLNVDALNSGSGGGSFDSGYGSVWRLVVALGGEKGFEAYNVLPGGQSGIAETENFADQAALWLGNDYLEVYLDPEDVAGAALRREEFVP